jgi:hypothetical protein
MTIRLTPVRPARMAGLDRNRKPDYSAASDQKSALAKRTLLSKH